MRAAVWQSTSCRARSTVLPWHVGCCTGACAGAVASLAISRRRRQRAHDPAARDHQHGQDDSSKNVDLHALTIIVIAFECVFVLSKIVDRGLIQRIPASQV